MGADSLAENAPNTLKFIRLICLVGRKFGIIVEKRLHEVFQSFFFWIKLMKYRFSKETMWPEISQSKIQKFSFF